MREATACEQMEATVRLKRPLSLHRYRPGEGAGLSLVSLAPLIAQVEFDRRDVRRRALVTAAKQAIFGCVPAVSARFR